MKKSVDYLLITNLRSWNYPLQHNDTIVHVSGYNYPSSTKMRVHNTPDDVNAIAYRPLLEIFHVSDLDKYALNAHSQKLGNLYWAPPLLTELGIPLQKYKKNLNGQTIRAFFCSIDAGRVALQISKQRPSIVLVIPRTNVAIPIKGGRELIF